MANAKDYRVELDEITATIAESASLSGAVDLGGMHLVGIIMPGTWTAANLTLQASVDGGATFANVHDGNGVEELIVAAASRHIILDPARFAGISGLKVRSGTSGSAVNQAAARTLRLVVRRV